MRCIDIRSAKATKTVSSPAMLPTTSGQRVRSRAAAIACADPGRVLQDQHQAGFADIHRQVVEEGPQALLPGALRLGDAGRDHVAVLAVLAGLEQTQLRHVPADRGLRCPEAALAKGGRQLLLGADGALRQQVADLALSELLHYLHDDPCLLFP